MLRICAVFGMLALAVSCGPSKPGGSGDDDDGSGSNDGPHVLNAIVINPLNPIVQLDLNTTGTQAFTVTGMYEDGTSEDLTAMATWTVDNPAVGAMTGATLNIPSFSAVSAEVSKVHATVDAIEGVAQVTVVAYRMTGAETDFFFTLPYDDPAGSQNKPLDFSTAIPALDVFFLMDTTGSMEGEITALESGLSSIVTTVGSAVADSEFGVAAFDDFPVDGDAGGEGGDGTLDQPFKLRQTITSNTSAVDTAISGLSVDGEPIGGGGDLPESGFEAVYQAVTGAGLTGPSPTSVPAGSVGFRMGTMPVVVEISDAISHGTTETAAETTACTSTGEVALNGEDGINYLSDVTPYAHSREETAAALGSACVRYVGIAPVTTCDAEEYMTYLSTESGARVPPSAWDVGTRPAGCTETQCCVGQSGAGMAVDADGLCPLVFRVSTSGTGVSNGIATGIEMLTRFAQFDVPTQTSGVTTDVTDMITLPSPYTTANFVKSITPVAGSAGYMVPPAPPVIPAPTIDANGLQFDGVTPGTEVVFTVYAYNDFVPQTDEAQIFEATIQVTASGCQVLDQRSVLILVPPTSIVIE